MSIKFSISSLLMKPSAFIPLLMSVTALSMVLVHWAIFGIVQETDEGTLAHIFQILIVAQIPVALYFFISWVNKKPKETFLIVVLQVVALLVAIVAVYFLI